MVRNPVSHPSYEITRRNFIYTLYHNRGIILHEKSQKSTGDDINLLRLSPGFCDAYLSRRLPMAAVSAVCFRTDLRIHNRKVHTYFQRLS